MLRSEVAPLLRRVAKEADPRSIGEVELTVLPSEQMKAVVERRLQERREVSWYARIALHRGFAKEERNGNGHGETLLENLSPGGVCVLSSEAFERGQLVELELICPSRKQPERGIRSFVVGRVAWVRKLPRPVRRGLSESGNGAPNPPGMTKRAVARMGIQFVSTDQTAMEWVEESLRRCRNSSNGNNGPPCSSMEN